MNTLLGECRAGLKEALEVFEVRNVWWYSCIRLTAVIDSDGIYGVGEYQWDAGKFGIHA